MHRFGDAFDQRNELCVGIARIAVVQAIDIGQERDTIRPRRLRHARGQPVIVAKAYFLGGYRIVLIDHRHRARFQQGRDGRRGIEIAPAPFEIFEREQQLCCSQPLVREQFGPQSGEHDLPYRCGGLRIGEASASAAGQAELRGAQRNRA